MSEVFVPVSGYEGYYEIGSMGTVRSVARRLLYSDGRVYLYKQRLITPADNGNGYMIVNLWRNNKQKMFYVHRLVADHFMPNPENKPQVNHLDENKKNNAVENLEWATPKENVNYGTAIARQIKTQGFPVFILFPDGTKKDFDSIAQAARFLGVQKGSATHAYHKHKKLKGVEIVGKFDS